MREVITIHTPVGAEIVLNGRRLVNFGGSSYLGLSSNTEILEAGAEALHRSGAGYQFAREYNIATGAHQAAESEAAVFFNTESAIYLAGGYSFGLVSLAGLKGKFQRIFFDEAAHYTLREGIVASSLPSHPYRHLQAHDLETQLRRHLRGDERPLIVTDGMYSVFGAIAPLDELARVIAPYGGHLIVDESHGFGVLGETGRGAHQQHHLAQTSLTIGGSTAKGLGVVGGLIPANEAEVAAFRATPAYRGASAGLAAAAAMCAASLRYVRRHPELLCRLRFNTRFMKERLRQLGLEVAESVAPIATFTVGSKGSMQGLQKRLFSEGIYVFYTTYIGAGTAGAIRCGIFADHTEEHIERLVDALRRLL